MDDFGRDQGEYPQDAVELFPARRPAAVAPPEPLAPQLGHLPPQLREHAVVAGDPVVGVVPAQLLVEFKLLLLQRQVAVFPPPLPDRAQRPMEPRLGGSEE